VSFLSRRIAYDRKRLLDRAAALETGWRWRKALTLYRQVLAAEPRCAEIHALAAPLLARSKRSVESWESYQVAIEAAQESGETTQARSILRAAHRALPTCAEACRALARVERALGRSEVSLTLLEKGSRRLARRGRRGEAILLLRDAREIESWNPEIVILLSRLLIRDRQAAEALYYLDHLERRVSSDYAREVRWLLWRVEPSLRHTWRWLTTPRAPRHAQSTTVFRSKRSAAPRAGIKPRTSPT